MGLGLLDSESEHLDGKGFREEDEVFGIVGLRESPESGERDDAVEGLFLETESDGDGAFVDGEVGQSEAIREVDAEVVIVFEVGWDDHVGVSCVDMQHDKSLVEELEQDIFGGGWLRHLRMCFLWPVLAVVWLGKGAARVFGWMVCADLGGFGKGRIYLFLRCVSIRCCAWPNSPRDMALMASRRSCRGGVYWAGVGGTISISPRAARTSSGGRW